MTGVQGWMGIFRPGIDVGQSHGVNSSRFIVGRHHHQAKFRSDANTFLLDFSRVPSYNAAPIHLLNNQIMSPLLQSSLTVEYALLGFVRRQPLHGYEIYRRLVETPDLHLIWRMKQSRLYALLVRLEEEGFLQAAYEPQDSRPPRKVYHLTPEGEAAFSRWLIEPVRLPREMRLEFMLKLYFAREEEADIVMKLVESQQEVCDDWLTMWANEETALSPFGRDVLRYRRKHIETIKDWLASLSDHVVPIEQSTL